MKKILKTLIRSAALLVLSALGASGAHAQSSFRYDNVVFKPSGGFVSFAKITVCNGAAFPIVPCTSGNASLFSDPALSLPLGNPVTSDVNGNYGFYVSNSQNYTITVTAAGFTGYSVAITPIASGGASNLSQLSGGTAPSGQTYNFGNATSLTAPQGGNAALKCASTDGCQFVSASGNDSNDGLSAGSARLTPAAAFTTISSGGNGGIVQIGAGKFVTNAQLVLPQGVIWRGVGRGGSSGNIATWIQAGATFPVSTALVTNGSSGVGNQINNLGLDCNNIAATGVLNNNGQEQYNLDHVLFNNCTGIGLDVESNNSQNSGPYANLEFIYTGSSSETTSSTLAMKFNAPGVLIRKVDGVTVNATGQFTAPNVGISINTPGTYENIHLEGVTTGIDVLVNGVTLLNIECSSNVTNCVKLESGTQNFSVTHIYGASTNLIVDTMNSITLTSSGETGVVGWYMTGASGAAPGQCSSSLNVTCSAYPNFKSFFYESASANPAQSGILRLAHSDFIGQRNLADSGDDTLGICSTSDNFCINGFPIIGTAARSSGLAPIRFPNGVSSLCSGWGVTQTSGTSTLTCSGITDPLGNTNAGQASSTASALESLFFTTGTNGQQSVNLFVGEFIVGGVWTRSVTANGYINGDTAPSISIIGTGFTASGSCNGNSNSGDGDWVWSRCLYEVTAIGTNPALVSFQVNFNSTFEVQVFAPVLNFIAAGTISNDEALAYENSLIPYDHNCTVGSLCGMAAFNPIQSNAYLFGGNSFSFPSGGSGGTICVSGYSTAGCGGGGGATAWSNIGNPSSNLALTMGSNTSTFNYTSNSAGLWDWINTTSATSGANQNTIPLRLFGQYWNGSVTEQGGWDIQGKFGTGTNPSQTLTFSTDPSGAPDPGLAAISVPNLINLGVASNAIYYGGVANITAGDATNFGWNDSTFTLNIGPVSGAHWAFTPTAANCIQSDGVTPCVATLFGAEGSASAPGVGPPALIGIFPSTDHLYHSGDAGKDYGPFAIVNRNWSGSANTYTSDALIPALLKYDILCGDPGVTNTGASTLNVNSLGATSITKFNGTALAAGDLVAGIPACVQYTGSAFSLLNPQTTSAGGGGSSVEVNGGSVLTTANFNGTTPAAGANQQNVTWQVSGSSVSAEVPLATTGQVGLVQLANDLANTDTLPEVVGLLSNALPSLATGYLHWTGSAWAFTTPVTSLTGDGTIFNNSASTGAVTLTFANAAAFTVLGNPTSSAATPVYTASPELSSVILEGSTSGSCTLNVAATAGTLQLCSTSATVTSGGAILGSVYKVSNGSFYEGASFLNNSVFLGGVDDSANNTSVSTSYGIFKGTDETGTGTTAAGVAIMRGGLVSSASGTPGHLQLGEGYILGTISAQWDVVAMTSTAYTVSDCASSCTNAFGIASSTTNPLFVIEHGQAPVNATAAVTIGHTVCTATTSGQVTDSGGTAPCTLGEEVGVVVATSGTVEIGSGTTATSVVLSTTLPLVALRIQ